MIESLTTVMLVDDHAVVRAGYRMLLEMSGGFSVIGEADTVESAISQYPNLRPDVVIMDLNLPGVSGIEATRRIVSVDPDAKILIFSIHDESIYISRAFDAGACGYLCKSCAPERMIEAVKTVASQGFFMDPTLASSVAKTDSGARDPIRWLSAREFEVFQLMGKGCGSREIAEALGVSAKTVANYRVIIKEKLGLVSTTELVKIAVRLAEESRI